MLHPDNEIQFPEYQAAQLGYHTIPTTPEDQLGHEDADPSQDWCVCAMTIRDQKDLAVQAFFEAMTTSRLNEEYKQCCALDGEGCRCEHAPQLLDMPFFDFLAHRSEIQKATDETFFEKKKTRTWKNFPCSDEIASLVMYLVGEFKFAKNPEGFQAMLDRNIAGPSKLNPKDHDYLWEGYWKNNPCKGGRVSLVKRADGGV
jgi:hypothetical protein